MERAKNFQKVSQSGKRGQIQQLKSLLHVNPQLLIVLMCVLVSPGSVLVNDSMVVLLDDWVILYLLISM